MGRRGTRRAATARLIYRRSDWHSWNDPDGNGFNTRAEILIASAKPGAEIVASKSLGILRGLWVCPYTDKLFNKADQMDIDHVVPLYWAHTHGGAGWTADQKRAFSNDPENLLAVCAIANRNKGAKGPARWLPPSKSFRKSYVKQFNKIVMKYGLTYRDHERRAISKWL